MPPGGTFFLLSLPLLCGPGPLSRFNKCFSLNGAFLCSGFCSGWLLGFLGGNMKGKGGETTPFPSFGFPPGVQLPRRKTGGAIWTHTPFPGGGCPSDPCPRGFPLGSSGWWAFGPVVSPHHPSQPPRGFHPSWAVGRDFRGFVAPVRRGSNCVHTGGPPYGLTPPPEWTPL